MKKKEWITLVIFILIIEAIGYLSSMLSGDISAAYNLLIKPPFSPPGIVFGIVWPILYALLGAAGYLIYRENSEESSQVFMWYLIQLLLNFSWSIIFFRFQAYWVALLVLILMDIITAYIIMKSRKINKYASLLMIPYLIWILYATYLNLGFALLN
ncbi:MAG: TspO/MBR family protein [Lachnospiraceae bacterium]